MESGAVCNSADGKEIDCKNATEISPGEQCQDIFLQIPAKPAKKKTTTFLNLPGEIRNLIYEYPCVWRTPTSWAARYPNWPFEDLRQPPITRVNRQLRHETLGFFYGKYRFSLELPMRPRQDDQATEAQYPVDFVSKMLNAFIPGPNNALQTSSLRFLSHLSIEMKCADEDFFLEIQGFTMSNTELECYDLGQNSMDTDSLDWNEDEEVREAYLDATRSSPVCEDAMKLLGGDIIDGENEDTASELSKVMRVVARHCPQLTSNVITFVVPKRDLGSLLEWYWFEWG